jgi:tetratricopeptide (TPR) repeat protein
MKVIYKNNEKEVNKLHMRIKKISILILAVILSIGAVNLFADDDLYTLKNQADSLFDEGQYSNALEKYLKIFTDTDIEPKFAGFIAYKIGRCYELMDDLDNSIQYYYKSLKINKELLNYKAVNVIYFRLGILFNKTKDTENAVLAFQNSFTVSQAIGNKALKAHSSFKLGLLFYVLEDNAQSLRYFLESFKYHMESNNLKNAGVIAYYMGNIYYEEERIEDAIHIWKLSMKALKEAGSEEWVVVKETLNSIDNN